MLEYLRVKDWERHQHYRAARPAWIKTYAALDDDYEFGLLGDAARSHLQGIWRLAARTGNRIPRDPAWICMKIHATTPLDLEALIAAGWLEPFESVSASGSKPCMDMQNPASPSTDMQAYAHAPAHSREGEKYVEVERETDPIPPRSSKDARASISKPLPPPQEERGERNGKPTEPTPGDEAELDALLERIREHPPGAPPGQDPSPRAEKARYAWLGEQGRWEKVERAIRLLWGRPDAQEQMLRMAATVPKEKRQRIYASATDTLERATTERDSVVARKDLIAAIRGPHDALPAEGTS